MQLPLSKFEKRLISPVVLSAGTARRERKPGRNQALKKQTERETVVQQDDRNAKVAALCHQLGCSDE